MNDLESFENLAVHLNMSMVTELKLSTPVNTNICKQKPIIHEECVKYYFKLINVIK